MGFPAKKLDDNWNEYVEIYKSFHILRSFPDRFIEHLARHSQMVCFPKEEKILIQGEMNKHLYFLVEGRIGIYVDGGCVSQLSRPGDLVGEMSVISSRPISATIVAESNVELLQVDTEEFLNVKGRNKDLFSSILYRIYSSALVEKLDITNQKAKYIEELNARLTLAQKKMEDANISLAQKVEERTQVLEQQREALIVEMKKTEDILNGKKRVFARLVQINKEHFIPLKGFLDDVRKMFPLEQSLEGARQGLFEVQHLIAPIVNQQDSEEAIAGKKVLFADPNKKQQVVAKTALGGTGVEMKIASTLEEADGLLAAEDFDLVVFGPETLDVGNRAFAKNPKVDLVMMTSDQVPNYLPALKQLQVVPQIVSRDEEDRVFTVKNILTTVSKLLSKNIFGLEKYLSWGVDIQTKPVFSSSQRADAIAEVDSYFARLGIRSGNRDRVRVVLEEMLMNAIYDAPGNAKGESIYNHLNRSVEVRLSAKEQGIIRFATDGVLMGVAVQDPFGSLKPSTILKYLEQNYSDPQHDINASLGKGGAGRGLHQIVENSDLVVFNIAPGERTEVIALFNVDLKDKRVQNSSFHLFVKNLKT